MEKWKIISISLVPNHKNGNYIYTLKGRYEGRPFTLTAENVQLYCNMQKKKVIEEEATKGERKIIIQNNQCTINFLPYSYSGDEILFKLIEGDNGTD